MKSSTTQIAKMKREIVNSEHRWVTSGRIIVHNYIRLIARQGAWKGSSPFVAHLAIGGEHGD